jgi:NADH-quinone oxidoreductase subunit E
VSEAGRERDQGAAGYPAFDPARTPGFSEALSLNPWLTHPAAAMAAATAMSFSLASQMTDAFFGALQGAMETANRFSAAEDRQPKAEPAEKPPVVAAAEAKTVAPKRTARAKPTSKATKTSGRAQASGDLRKIAGLGPRLEKRLQDMGVTRLEQIAGWTEADIARIEMELGFDGRIGRDDWVGKAKALLN